MTHNFILTPQTIDVWYIDLTQQNINQAACYAVLDNDEQTQAARFKFSHLSDQYIRAHGLLRLIMARYLRVEAASLQIARTAQGKPYLLDYPNLHFNISHSGTQLLIALAANVPLGVDIELIKTRVAVHDLVARCFAPSEQRYWQALPETEKTRQFYAFWTRKEAFVKATGLGIVVGLEQCEIDVDNPRCFLNVPANCGVASDWRVMDLPINTNCCAAVVAKAREFSVRPLLFSDL